MAKLQSGAAASANVDDEWVTVHNPNAPQSPSPAIEPFQGPSNDNEWATVAVPTHYETPNGLARDVNGMLEGDNFLAKFGDVEARPVYGKPSAPKPVAPPVAAEPQSYLDALQQNFFRGTDIAGRGISDIMQGNVTQGLGQAALGGAGALFSPLGATMEADKAPTATGNVLVDAIRGMGTHAAQNFHENASTASATKNLIATLGADTPILQQRDELAAKQYDSMRPWTEAPNVLQAITEFLGATGGTVAGGGLDPINAVGGSGPTLLKAALKNMGAGGVGDVIGQLTGQTRIKPEYDPNAEAYNPATQAFEETGPAFKAREYSPVQTAVSTLTAGILPASIEAALNPEARKELSDAVTSFVDQFRAKAGNKSKAPPTAEEVQEALRSKDVNEILMANNATESPKAEKFAAKIEERRAAEAARAPAQDLNDIPLADVIKENERLQSIREGIAAGEIDKSYGVAPERVPQKLALHTARDGTMTPMIPDAGTAAGAELRNGTFNLPAVIQRSVTDPEPTRMTPREIAIANKQMETPRTAEEVSARVFNGDQVVTEQAAPGRLLGGDNMAPRTAGAVEGQAKAAEAFDLADKQRGRLAAAEDPKAVRDTQAAGLEKGIQPVKVDLDEGNPVKILSTHEVEVNGKKVQMATVRRYDPRTNQFEADSIEYPVQVSKLKSSNYTPEPRRAQDFATRAQGPRQPELPRQPGDGVKLEPKQTFRATEPDPNLKTDADGNRTDDPLFPAAGEGRSPLPPQPEPPPRRYSTAEEAVKDFQARQKQKDQSQEQARTERAKSRHEGAKSSNTPKGQDGDGRWHIDEDGYVLSDKGGPVKFDDHKQGGLWIVNRGQKLSPDQNFELANHPSGSGVTARETSRTAKAEEFKGKKGMNEDAPKGQAGDRSEESFKKEAGTADEAKADPGPAKGLGGPEEAKVKEEAPAEPKAEATEDVPPTDKFKAERAAYWDEHSKASGDMGERMSDLERAKTPEEKARAEEGIAEAQARRDAASEKIQQSYRDERVAAKEATAAQAEKDREDLEGYVARSFPSFTTNDVKSAVSRVIELVFGGREELALHFAENTKIFSTVAKPAEAAKRLWRGSTAITGAVFLSTDGRVRSLARQLKSKTMEEVADTFHAEAGGKRATKTTYEEAVSDKVTTAMNSLSEALGPFMAKPDVLDQIVRQIQSGQISNGTPIGEAAATIRKMLKDELEYLRKSGVDIGEVKSGYFPREFEHMAVMSNSEGFKKAAAHEFRLTGLDAKSADEAAETLLNSILLGTDGISAFNGGTGGSRANFTAGRVFGKGADNRMREFYIQDPTRVLSNYFNRSARRAEAAKRFGDQWEKWAEIERKIGEEVGPKDADAAISAARALAMASTGMRTTAVNPHLVAASAWIRTMTTLALLSKVSISSLQELVMPGVRSGSLLESFKSIAKAGVEATLMMSGTKSNAIELAEDLGVIYSHLGQSVQVARFFGDDPGSVFLQKANRNFFRNTGLEQLTNITRALSAATAQTFIRRMAKSANSEFSKIHLRELGIPDEKHKGFVEWLSSIEDMKPGSEHLKMTGKKVNENVQMYRTAVQRFVNQSIQNPTAATKPGWASHPLGAIVFQLNSFNMAFGKNVLLRAGKRMKEAVTNEHLTSIERAKMMVQTVAPLILLSAVGVGISMKRDELFRTQKNETASDKKKIAGDFTVGDFREGVRQASRVGAFGGFDPWVNFFTQARYGDSPLSALTGPSVGTIGDFIQLVPDLTLNNSSKNNKAERKAARLVYDRLMEPAANLLINTVMPPNLLGAAATQYLGTNQAREGFVSAIAGKDKKRPQRVSSAAPAAAAAPVQMAAAEPKKKNRSYAVTKDPSGRTIVEVLEG